MIDLSTLHAQLVAAEANARAARLAVERAIAERIREQPAQPDEKKVPPTFGDSESHKPQES